MIHWYLQFYEINLQLNRKSELNKYGIKTLELQKKLSSFKTKQKKMITGLLEGYS